MNGTVYLALSLIAAVQGSCNRYFVGSTNNVGVLASPNFPFFHPISTECTVDIYLAHFGTRVKEVCFRFKRFDVEHNGPLDNPQCSFDYLILDNEKFCGNGKHERQDSRFEFSSVWANHFCKKTYGSKFRIIFKSDQSKTHMGFYANFYVKIFNEPNIKWCNLECPPSGVSKIYNEVHEAKTCICDYIKNVSVTAPCKSNEFTCFNRRCVNEFKKCDGVDHCEDGSDELHAHAICTYNLKNDSSACHFGEGLCSWTSRGFKRVRPRYGFIYHADHTYGPLIDGIRGYYLYADTDDFNPATLKSMLPKTAFSKYCLSFWYYMKSPSLNDSLSVYGTNKHSGVKQLLWRRTGNRGAKWLPGEVQILTTKFKEVLFEANYQFAHGLNHEISLDDISILEGLCRGGDISCTLDGTFCGWSHVVPAEFRSSEDKNKTHQFKHKFEGGNVAGYLMVTSFGHNEATAQLVSPVVSLVDQLYCFSFRHRVQNTLPGTEGISINETTITVRQMQIGNGSVSVVKSLNQFTVNIWSTSSMAISNSSLPYVIVVSVKFTGFLNIAIYDIQMTEGDCPTFMPRNETQEKPVVNCPLERSFRCQNGRCIHISFICNFINDCGDNSDEDKGFQCRKEAKPLTTTPRACKYQMTSYGSDEFVCHNGCSVFLHEVCDGDDDCLDNSDEESHCTGQDFKGKPMNTTLTNVVISMTALLSLLFAGVVIYCRCRKKRLTMTSRDSTRDDNGLSLDHNNDITPTAPPIDDPPPYSTCVSNPSFPNDETAPPPPYESLFKDTATSANQYQQDIECVRGGHVPLSDPTQYRTAAVADTFV